MRPKIGPTPWQTTTTSIAKIQFEYAKFCVGQAYAYAPPLPATATDRRMQLCQPVYTIRYVRICYVCISPRGVLRLR